MKRLRKSTWIALLSSGLGVAIFGFIANTAWEIYRHRSVAPEYVNAVIRFEENTLFLYVRNNSNEPLDLVQAKIEIDDPNLIKFPLGAYPDVSKIYNVSSSVGDAAMEIIDNKLVVNLRIIQAIEPGKSDNFGIKIQGLLGPINLSKAKVHAELRDIAQHTYIANY